MRLPDFKAAYINAPKEKKIKVTLLLLRNGEPLMKYYTAFKSHDMELLNNVLYESAHLMQISNISNTGTDHGFYGMNISPNLLAANMMERVKLILPEENGLANNYNDKSTIHLPWQIMPFSLESW